MQLSFHITDEQYRLLLPTGQWHINDIPLDKARLVRGHFGNVDSFALFTSGANADPAMIGTQDKTLIGLDWIRNETKPKPNEPALNVYHFVVTSGSAGLYPVFYCGHSGALAPGWSELNDLEVYLRTANQ